MNAHNGQHESCRTCWVKNLDTILELEAKLDDALDEIESLKTAEPEDAPKSWPGGTPKKGAIETAYGNGSPFDDEDRECWGCHNLARNTKVMDGRVYCFECASHAIRVP